LQGGYPAGDPLEDTPVNGGEWWRSQKAVFALGALIWLPREKGEKIHIEASASHERNGKKRVEVLMNVGTKAKRGPLHNQCFSRDKKDSSKGMA